MIINNLDENVEKIFFSKLKSGDIFKYGSKIFMKINNADIYNAVRLHDGGLIYVACDELVLEIEGSFNYKVKRPPN